MPVGNLYGALRVYDISSNFFDPLSVLLENGQVGRFRIEPDAGAHLDDLCKSCALHVTTQFFSFSVTVF